MTTGTLSRAARRRSPSDRAALALLAGVIIGSALLIGAVHNPSIALVAAAAAGAALLASRGRLSSGKTVVVPLLGWLWLALACFTLLQCVPLPVGLLARIAPSSADVWSRALLPFAEAGPSWAPVSLDPSATRVEALRLFAYACTAIAAANVHDGPAAVARFVVASGAAVAVATMGHALVSARKVFGVYEPSFGVTDWHVGPLLNSNSLAGYLNLATLVALGMIAGRRATADRALLGLGAATMVSVTVRAGSRGGLLALIVGTVVFLVAALLTRNRRPEDAGRSWVAFVGAGATMVSALVFVLLGGTRHALADLNSGALHKLAMVGWTRPMVEGSPWLGIGRGAFESVFEAYRPERYGNQIYTHAENFPVQWISEWGVPVGAVALGIFLWSLRPRALGVGHRLGAAGAFAGIFALLLQNLVDLALEIPAVPIALTAIACSFSAPTTRRRATSAGRSGPTYFAAVGAILLAASAIVAPGHTLARDRATMRAALDAVPPRDAMARSAFRAELRSTMLRHPAESYFSLLGAMLALDTGDESPSPWLERALERAPLSARAHLLLAHVLARRGTRGQSLLELKLAASYDPDLLGAVSRAVVRLARSPEEALEAVPDGPLGTALLDRISTDLHTLHAGDEGAAWLALELDLEACARDRAAVNARFRVAEAILFAMEHEPSPFARVQCPSAAACAENVRALAEDLEALAPDSSSGAQLRARLALVRGDAQGALDLLEAHCPRPRGQGACSSLRLMAAEQLARTRRSDASTSRLEQAIREFLASRCAEAVSCADAHTEIGELRFRLGQPARAVHHLTRAARDDPRESRWRTLAAAAQRAGLSDAAFEARRHLEGKGASPPPLSGDLPVIP